MNPAWQAQSLSLSYPDDDLVARLPLLRRVAAAVPSPVGEPLDRFLDHVAATPLPELAAEYVATFDHRKRFAPYLTSCTEAEKNNDPDEAGSVCDDRSPRNHRGQHRGEGAAHRGPRP